MHPPLPLFTLLCLFASAAIATADTLPRRGLKLHLDAASAVVSKDSKVGALNDRGPLKLRVKAAAGNAGFGGLLNKAALNGQDTITIQNNGFRIDAKTASELNASDKGFTLVLVAKALPQPAAAALQLVRKQSTPNIRQTGYSVQLDSKEELLFLWAVENGDNRRSVGVPALKDWFVLVMSADISAGKLDASLNGLPLPKKPFARGKPSAFSNNNPFEIGAGPSGMMEFAELAFYDRPLSAGEQKQAAAALVAKYAIAQKPAVDPADWLIPGNGFEPFGPPQTRRLDQEPKKLRDGRLLAFQGAELITSTDGGKTWPESGRITVFNSGALPPELKDPPAISIFTITSSGAWIVLAQSPNADPFKVFNRATNTWPPEITGKAAIYVTRSTDQGKTWSAPVCVFRPEIRVSYFPRNIVEAAPGVLVFPAQYSTRDPGHAITIIRSTDDGRTWENTGATFTIPVIVKGLHDGIFEPAMIRLNDPDKTSWILFRTNLGCFWESRSTDQGKTWSPFSPTNIQASSSPGTFLRLSDNRIVLIYNPWKASDGTVPDMRGGGGVLSFSATLASWQRRELVLITTRDEGKTWSKPLVIARHPSLGGRSATHISYPGAWENDGYLHIVTAQGKLQARIPLDKLP